MTSEEAVGVSPRLVPETQDGPPTEAGAGGEIGFIRNDVVLLLEVQSMAPPSVPGAERLSAGSVVAAPITVWLGGEGPSGSEAIVADIAERLRATAPVGTPTLVLSGRIVDAGTYKMVELAPPRSFSGPASIVFQSTDSGLVSLDWTLGDSAEEYFGASSLDQLAAMAIG